MRKIIIGKMQLTADVLNVTRQSPEIIGFKKFLEAEQVGILVCYKLHHFQAVPRTTGLFGDEFIPTVNVPCEYPEGICGFFLYEFFMDVNGNKRMNILPAQQDRY